MQAGMSGENENMRPALSDCVSGRAWCCEFRVSRSRQSQLNS